MDMGMMKHVNILCIYNVLNVAYFAFFGLLFNKGYESVDMTDANGKAFTNYFRLMVCLCVSEMVWY